jgi:ATP-binding cassette subfamily B multidrug efflux pump
VKNILRLRRFVQPYYLHSLFALILLTCVVLGDLAIPRLVERIIDQGISMQDQGVIISTTLIMLAISVTSALFAIGNNLLSVRVGEAAGRDIRAALFEKIQSFSFSNLDRQSTGQLMVRLTSDISMVQRMLRISIRIGTRAPLLMIGSLILMVSTSSRLALSIMPVLMVTGVVIGLFITRTQPLYLAIQGRLDSLNRVLQENIAGIRVVKAFTRGTYEIDRFSTVNRDFTEQNIVVMQYLAFLMPALSLLINIGIMIVIWTGGIQVIHGSLTLGQIVAFANYLLTTMTPLVIMSNLAQVLAAANASAERILQVLDESVLVQDRPYAHPLPAEIQGRVEFEEVCFSYDGAYDEPVLDGISLVAEPGQRIAILGATGAGKTTLVNLIPRFYDVTRGRITVDGFDVRDLQQDSLLASIGIVLQESVLFSGSVRENISYGRPSAEEEEIIFAARAAQAHDFILQLPQGYDTHVEERGVNLSGGQKQRLAIARAILLRPRILILDDSTSSVDIETETRIQDALNETMGDCTTFIVAQRISTVLNADRILVLERGRISAEGTHSQLLKTSPIYQEIYDSQLGDGLVSVNGPERSGRV